MFNLKNKKVIVTGATGGIGSAIVECFINHNAKVLAKTLALWLIKHSTIALPMPPVAPVTITFLFLRLNMLN